MIINISCINASKHIIISFLLVYTCTGGADVLIVNIDGSDQYYHCKYRQQCMYHYILFHKAMCTRNHYILTHVID